MEYCKCGSLIDIICTNKRCPDKNNSLRKWVVEGIEYKFTEPMTKSEAEEAVKGQHITVIRSKGNPYIERAIIN